MCRTDIDKIRRHKADVTDGLSFHTFAMLGEDSPNADRWACAWHYANGPYGTRHSAERDPEAADQTTRLSGAPNVLSFHKRSQRAASTSPSSRRHVAFLPPTRSTRVYRRPGDDSRQRTNQVRRPLVTRPGRIEPSCPSEELLVLHASL